MKRIVKNPLVWIFLIALFLRLYKLGELPFGFHVDEVRAAWNAVSILKTGLDDHLNRFSLYYNSIGDYRPTGIFYFIVPSILLFGRTIFAARFSVALFGALMIFPLYFLTNLLIKDAKINNLKLNLGHLAAFLMAISPWHIELSRATNEVVISTFFTIFAFYFYIKYIEKRKIISILFFTISILLSYFLYHAVRFVAPAAFLLILIYYFKKVKTISLNKILPVVIPVLFVFALSIFLGSTKEGAARFNQVSVFTNVDTTYEINRIRNENLNPNILMRLFDNKIIIYTKHFITQYSQYFSGDFLVGELAKPYRFTTPGTGILTYIEFILLVFGLIDVIKNKRPILLMALLIVGPLPGAFTSEDVPNLSRTFIMLPFLLIIEALGLYSIANSFKAKKSLFLIALLLILLNFTYFYWMYFNHAVNHRPFLKNYDVDSPTYRNVGTIELVLGLDSLSKKYDKIIVTNFPDSPYPWYAYFTGKSPSEFNKTYKPNTKERNWGNIIFSEEKCPSDDDFWKYSDQNILVIDSWECGYESQIKAGSPMKVLSKITRSDGSEVFILLERDWNKEFPKDILDKIKQISKK